MQPRLLATMVTTTTYGAWLPGDIRGYVENGIILPGDPARFDLATELIAGRSAILLSRDQQQLIFDALQRAATEFKYRLTDASIESWHAHWIVEHGFDSVPTMVGRLKNRMRQALNVGRIWTEGYYDSRMFESRAVATRSNYIARHGGCRMTNGALVLR